MSSARLRLGVCTALALAAGACATAAPPPAPAVPADATANAATTGPVAGVAGSGLDAALASITANDLLAHIRVLASDRFEGRAPGTPGEDSTVNYLVAQFRRLGLQPGNPDGSYVQNVPLVGFTAKPTASFRAGGRTIALTFPDDYVAVSRRVQPQVHVENSDLVFVGYGVVAPEYGWDDYKGLDVRGKTIVMLINDPAVPDPANPAQLDSTLFRGKAMTYYGRWTYKYEIASEKGAAAAIIVHETEPASYPYEVVKGSWSRENIDIKPADGNLKRVPVESWITVDKARELFRAAGQDFEAMKRAAVRKDFRPVPLNATFSVRLQNTLREIQSRNVVAKLPGAARPDEYVVYTAHWDHLGKDPNLPGDQIYNGAHDNASGTAALLEMAEAYTKLPARPDRSILFLAVTAEEKGLLGAKYYANNPLYPLAKTVANINVDGLNQWGRTRDMVIVGWGNTTLDEVLATEAAKQGRIIKPDPTPERGGFYRSDHFEFAKQGVPALYAGAGDDYVGKPAGWGAQKDAEFTAQHYHKPSDEIMPDWDLSGAVEDVRLYFQVGHRISQTPQFPEWRPGTEFRAKREQMLK